MHYIGNCLLDIIISGNSFHRNVVSLKGTFAVSRLHWAFLEMLSENLSSIYSFV